MPRRKKGPSASDPSRAPPSLRTINQKEKPQQRNAANARERARMRVLSRAFYRLKTALSWVPPDTKLSKLDTLRMAAKHIAGLKATLESNDPISQSDYFYAPMTMTWPYGLSKAPGGSGVGGGTGSEEGEEDCGLDEGSLSSSSWDEVTPVTSALSKDDVHMDHGHSGTLDHGHSGTLDHGHGGTQAIGTSVNDNYHHPHAVHQSSNFNSNVIF